MGDPAYEQRRREMREQREDQERSFEVRRRREAEADELIDLAMKALRAFLEGKAALVIESSLNGGPKHVRFQFTHT